MMTDASTIAVASRNVRLFMAFRILFNIRFYYPVFMVMFLRYGITLEQFGLLNAAWAIVIVLLEVPSGALADLVGRKALLVAAAVMMWPLCHRSLPGCCPPCYSTVCSAGRPRPLPPVPMKPLPLIR